MAILRVLNEFGREGCILTIEPARRCVSSCTYCFAKLNSSVQWGNKNIDISDKSTFESIITRAFSPGYEPQNYIQFSLHERYPICYANTVEPFQDIDQARSILKILDLFNVPVWFQTKSLNMNDVWDYLKPFHNNSSVLLSFPTMNQDIIKRFEPGTPTVSERIAAVERLADAGFQVTLGLAPYHEDWVDDPVPFLESALSWGVSAVFLDRLHLNRRQRRVAPDRAMVGIAGATDRIEWPERMISHYKAIYEFCSDQEILLYGAGPIPVLYGFNNTSPAIIPPSQFSRGREWPFHDGVVLQQCENVFKDDPEYDPEAGDSLLVTWEFVEKLIRLMPGFTEQPFTYSSLRDLISLKTLPVLWRNAVKPAATPLKFLNALWNNPHDGQFMWRHPWARVAFRPDGSPHVDQAGNIIMIFDPDFTDPVRVESDLSEFRTFDLGGES